MLDSDLYSFSLTADKEQSLFEFDQQVFCLISYIAPK